MRLCWQPIHIFHYLISCLHQCFTNIDFPSQISNERRPYSLRLFDRLSSLNLHSRKHEIFSSRGHILIIIWIAGTVIMLIAPIFYWSSHDQHYPLIGFHTSMVCNNSLLLKIFCLWIHILQLVWTLSLRTAWGLGFIFCDSYYWSLW